MATLVYYIVMMIGYMLIGTVKLFSRRTSKTVTSCKPQGYVKPRKRRAHDCIETCARAEESGGGVCLISLISL